MRLFIISFSFVFCSLTGCSADYWLSTYKPSTYINAQYGPARFTLRDSKDNDIDVQGVEYDPVTKQFKINQLQIRNNSSDVVNATAARAAIVGQAQLSQVAYVQAMGNTISQIIGSAGQAAPGLIKAFLSRVPSQIDTTIDFPVIGGGVSINRETGGGPEPGGTSRPGE